MVMRRLPSFLQQHISHYYHGIPYQAVLRQIRWKLVHDELAARRDHVGRWMRRWKWPTCRLVSEVSRGAVKKGAIYLRPYHLLVWEEHVHRHLHMAMVTIDIEGVVWVKACASVHPYSVEWIRNILEFTFQRPFPQVHVPQGVPGFVWLRSWLDWVVRQGFKELS